MAKPKKTGRPDLYEPAKHLPELERILSEGKTMSEAAKEIGVALSTLYLWMAKDPALSEALKKTRAVVDEKVEASLFQRAMGYSHPDVHISNYQGEITVTPITKHYPPDTTAMIFWLKNRQPKQWRDRVDADVKLEAGDTLSQLIHSIRAKT